VSPDGETTNVGGEEELGATVALGSSEVVGSLVAGERDSPSLLSGSPFGRLGEEIEGRAPLSTQC